jgi:hypothetical protein
MPGYYHSVPTGQIRRPPRLLASRNRPCHADSVVSATEGKKRYFALPISPFRIFAFSLSRGIPQLLAAKVQRARWHGARMAEKGHVIKQLSVYTKVDAFYWRLIADVQSERFL